MSATQVPKSRTAFPLSTGSRRRPRVKADAHLAFIRTLPCLVSGRWGPSEAAHIRMASAAHGKRHTGLQEKPSDWWVVPLSPEWHRAQHSGAEIDFWRARNIDPLVVAALLYANTGDAQAGIKIMEAARSGRFPWME